MQSQNDVNKLSGLCTVPSVSEIYCNSTFRKLLSCETYGNKMTLFMNRWDLIQVIICWWGCELVLQLLPRVWQSISSLQSRVFVEFSLKFPLWCRSIMRSSFTRMWFLIIFVHIITLGISYKFFKIMATYNENAVKHYCIFSVLCKVFYYYFSIIYLELLNYNLGHRCDIKRLTRMVFNHEEPHTLSLSSPFHKLKGYGQALPWFIFV